MIQRTKPPLKCPFMDGKPCMEAECAMFEVNTAQSTVPGWCAFLGLSHLGKLEFKLNELASAFRASREMPKPRFV